MPAARIQILGVDIGGVIIEKHDDEPDTSFFGPHFLDTPAVPGALEALRALQAGGTFAATHLVSKCGEEVERKTRAWLAHRAFFASTGIPEAHLHVCRRRPEKADICRALGVTHFVDDRLDVLGLLEGVVPLRILFASPGQVRPVTDRDSGVIVVSDWATLRRRLRGF